MPYVVPFVFGKAVNENRQRTQFEYNQHPKTTRFTLPRPGDALFDHASTEFGGYQPTLGFTDCLTRSGIRDACFPRKAANALLRNIRNATSITLSVIERFGCAPKKSLDVTK